jgi:hypothetical protein
LQPIISQPADYVTVAGNVTSDLYVPALGRHGLVIEAALDVVGGADVPVSDDIVLVHEDTTSTVVGVRVVEWIGTIIPNFRSISLIGGVSNVNGFQWVGARPVYVPAGQRLRLTHGSVAGGVTLHLRGWVLDLPESYPIRLP